MALPASTTEKIAATTTAMGFIFMMSLQIKCLR
jgi:hypothetical protein